MDRSTHYLMLRRCTPKVSKPGINLTKHSAQTRIHKLRHHCIIIILHLQVQLQPRICPVVRYRDSQTSPPSMRLVLGCLEDLRHGRC